MAKRNRQGIKIFGILFLLCICLMLIGVVLLADQAPKMARKTFGAPSPSLGPLDRLTLSIQLLLSQEELTNPANPGGEPQRFQIGEGESVNSIILRLEGEGLIRSASAFRLFLIYAGLDTGIQAGTYELDPSQNGIALAYALQDATPTEVTFVILPGWRAEEIARSLPTSGLQIDPNEFLQAVYNPPTSWLPQQWKLAGSLEGYLFPGEYVLPRDITLEELILTILNRFDQDVTSELRSAMEAQGLSLAEGVILASIVQREGVVDDERPMIASVFYNRLAIGMKLDSDPTVQYALGYQEAQNSWWKNPLSLDDLKVNSSYNTYQNMGLPPGAICNPGLSALQAVAYPAQSPYYYFRAQCDQSGRHFFAVTFEEHLNNACP